MTLIGEGSYGRVVSLGNDNCEKIFKGSDFKVFIRESYFLSYMRQIDSVVDIIEISKNKEENTYSIVMPVSGVNLRNWLLSRRKGYKSRVKIVVKIIQAVADIHGKCGVIHGDIKLENILIDREDNIRLIDFGLSGYPGYSLSEYGSTMYKPPVTTKSFGDDIYSLGIVISEMLVGDPFPRPLNSTHLNNAINMAVEKKIMGSDGKDWKELIFTMMGEVPQARPSMMRICNYLGIPGSVEFIPHTISVKDEGVSAVREELSIMEKQFGRVIRACILHECDISDEEINQFNLTEYCKSLIDVCDSSPRSHN
jgi:serine/threonine protein kinase